MCYSNRVSFYRLDCLFSLGQLTCYAKRGMLMISLSPRQNLHKIVKFEIQGRPNRSFCYSEKESESNDIFMHFEELLNVNNGDRKPDINGASRIV